VSSTEVVSVSEADQFQSGKSQFACGYYGVAMLRSMAPVGSVPTLTPAQIAQHAEQWYTEANGPDTLANTYGMTTAQLYALLLQIGLHYQAAPADLAHVRAWLTDGIPCVLAVEETSVHDLELDANPYPWTAAGNHIIVATGVTTSGDLLVRDSANCTDLYDPNSLRPGPRRYRADALRFVSVTAVIPPWRPRPTAGLDPTTTPLQQEEELVTINIQTPGVAAFYTATGDVWTCKYRYDATQKRMIVSGGGAVLGHGILAFYQKYGGDALCGLTYLGLPLTGEAGIAQGVVIQAFERGIVVYDPQHHLDRPLASGDIYLLNLTSGAGQSLLKRLFALVEQRKLDDLTARLNTQPDVQAQARLAQALATLAHIHEESAA